MRRFWLLSFALLVVLSVALAGCGGGDSVDPYDDSYYDEDADDASDDPGSDDSEPAPADATDAEPTPDESDGSGDAEPGDTAGGEEGADGEPTDAEKDAHRLYQEALLKYSEAKTTWDKFRDETQAYADWQQAKKLVEEALDSLDKLAELAPDYKKKEDLAENATTFRMMLLENKPDPDSGGEAEEAGGEEGASEEG